MKKLLIILIVVASGIGLFRLLSSNPSVSGVTDAEADLILYWGDGCTHCEKVKDFIKENNSDTKAKIALKEVYYNKQNQLDLEATVKKCPEIDASQGIGVPLAFSTADQKCLYGDTPIIEWLSAR